MKINLLLTLILVILNGSVQNVNAKSRSTGKKKIAVLPLSSENVSLSLSNISRNALELKFYNSESFLLIEIANIKKIARSRRIDAAKFSNNKKALSIGKALKADFVICGSIEKIKQYKMIIKVISIETGEILTAYSKEFTKDIKLYDVSEKISQNIVRDIEIYLKKGYLQKKRFDYNNLYFSLFFNYAMPLENFKKLVNPGPGFSMNFMVDNILYENSVLGLQLGYSAFSGKKNSSDVLTYYYLQAHFGYNAYVTQWFFIKPYINIGPNLVIMKHGTGEGFNMSDNSEKQVIEPYASLGAALSFIPVTDNVITLGLDFNILLEAAENIYTLQFYLGYSRIF